MSKTLYLFIVTPTLAAYINAMAASISCDVKNIVMVTVEGLSSLIIGIREVAFFELAGPSRGIASLYHNLRSGEYEYVKQDNTATLKKAIKSINTRANRKRLISLIIALSCLLLIPVMQFISTIYQISPWLTSVTAAIGLVSSILTILTTIDFFSREP